MESRWKFDSNEEREMGICTKENIRKIILFYKQEYAHPT
jgi:hypothetical protein